MELRAKLGEEDLARVHVGSAATVTPVSSDKHFTGQVWQIAPTIDAQSRQGEARIALAYAPELRPGGFASATLSSGTVVAPMLPESAIQTDDNGQFVFVVGKGDKVVRQPIKTGLVTENGIAIVAGLSGNERVVLRAGGFLAPGDKVKPVAAR
jgi:HlyD family secretion protein